jgi:hypothetical protein
MALSFQSGACSSGVPTIATNLTVASVERLTNSSARVWFTLPPDVGGGYADYAGNYTITGPETVAVSRATATSANPKAIDLFFDKALSYGQWTISFVSANIKTGSITLPPNTTYVFSVVDINQESPGLPSDNNLTKKFLNPAFWGKSNWEALIDTLEDSRADLSDLVQKSFNQSYLSSASDKYLSIRAAGAGIKRPLALGLVDETFRDLAVSLINRKLTINAHLSLLEILYGPESTRANVTSVNAEPYQLFDQATLTFIIDGATLPVVFDWDDFSNMSIASAEEICFVINQRFLVLGSTAFAVPYLDNLTDQTFVRIFSGTIGLRSTIAVTGGTARPILNFGESLFPPSVYVDDYLGGAP